MAAVKNPPAQTNKGALSWWRLFPTVPLYAFRRHSHLRALASVLALFSHTVTHIGARCSVSLLVSESCILPLMLSASPGLFIPLLSLPERPGVGIHSFIKYTYLLTSVATFSAAADFIVGSRWQNAGKRPVSARLQRRNSCWKLQNNKSNCSPRFCRRGRSKTAAPNKVKFRGFYSIPCLRVLDTGMSCFFFLFERFFFTNSNCEKLRKVVRWPLASQSE